MDENKQELTRDPAAMTVALVVNEIEAGLTLARIARDSDPKNREKIERERTSARKAYDTAVAFRAKASFTGHENEVIEGGLSELRDMLQELGESVP